MAQSEVSCIKLARQTSTGESSRVDDVTGDNSDKWFPFKKPFISFMNIPPDLVCESLNNYLGAHLEGTALDTVGQETNGFLKYMPLIENFEHLCMSQFIKITEQLYSGITYDSNVDTLFRDYQDLHLMLKDFKAELDPRPMIAFILRSLPESLLAAKSVIGLREKCTLEEARVIIPPLISSTCGLPLGLDRSSCYHPSLIKVVGRETTYRRLPHPNARNAGSKTTLQRKV